MAERIPYEIAAAASRANAAARMPERGTENRMEPACWPELRPGFRIGREDGIFVIGSCFATNIEDYLLARGYRMLARRGLEGSTLAPGHLNKYTPASIREEVAWARAIRDRDDRMTAADAEKLFFVHADGQVTDTQLHVFDPLPYDAALERRRIVYDIYRGLFSADVVVLTLGLIEAWWDDALGLYIQGAPTRAMLRGNAGRFLFEQLDHDTCLSMMRETMEMIRRDHLDAQGQGGPGMLLTTSPVALARTFTDDDVIVANMYSKSVLRAVTGQIVRETPGVEYFPSYESVMLTRDRGVWLDDLKHVSEQFVRRIMLRVEEAYTDAPAASGNTGADEAVEEFLMAMEGRELDRAGAIYDRIDAPLSVVSEAFHTKAALRAMLAGDATLARAHLEAETGRGPGETADSQMLLRYTVWRRIGTGAEAEAFLGRVRGAKGRGLAPLAHRASRWLIAAGMQPEAVDMILRVRPEEVRTEALLKRFSVFLAEQGEPDAAAAFAALLPEADRPRRSWPGPRG